MSGALLMKSPMLACKFDEKKVRTHLPLCAQPKLDGIRVFIRDGVAYSRSLKPIRNRAFQEAVREHWGVVEHLDGEVIAGPMTAPDAYRRTSSSLMSFDGGWDDFTFHVFDAIYDHALPFYKRRNNLTGWILTWQETVPWVRCLESHVLYTIEQIYEYEQQLLDQGHEGVILRNPNSFYKFGRSSPGLCELVKLKRFIDAEATIIGYEELRSNQNEATINALGHTERSGHQENLVPMGVLGALIGAGMWPKEVLSNSAGYGFAHLGDGAFEVRIGSGFTAEQRAALWNERESLIGQTVKFKFFGGGVKEAPRFPIFLGFRDKEDM